MKHTRRSVLQRRVKGHGPRRRVIDHVFDVQRSDGYIAVQMFTNVDNSGGNLIVIIDDPSFTLNEKDYLRVSGTVHDKFTGENAFGAEVSAPRVAADSYEVVDATAVDPARQTFGPKIKWLGGTKLTVRNVELSDKQTRVYVRFTNEGGDEFTGTTPSVAAGGEQVDADYSDDSLKAPSGSISPGASSSGVLVFEKATIAPVRITFDGYDADFNEIHSRFVYG